MRRSGLSKAPLCIALLPLAGFAQPWLTHEGDLWVRTYNDTAPAKPRVRINSHGPVWMEGNASPAQFVFSVKVAVRARTQADARVRLEKLQVRAETQGEWLVVTTPGGYATSSVVMHAPRLVEAYVTSSDGQVEVYGVDGPLHVDTGANQIKVDRIHGDCGLSTGGGDIQAGRVDGSLYCTTVAGAIRSQLVGRDAVFQTNGGDIEAQQVNGLAHVETGGGTVHIHYAGGQVTAVNGGGPIIIDRAGGVVTVRNVAGAVHIGAAAGIRCESSNGGNIQLSHIVGPMSVSTDAGNILANLMGSRLAESLLATGNGDITVVIPSNISVTIRAENQMADTLRRIVSEFREIQPRPIGTHLVAQGQVNGGGPLLQISASAGTIFLKRQ
jgi:DUF4097 and DUF4098 domain-containing protein YvlB